jgi:hypothetical protein
VQVTPSDIGNDGYLNGASNQALYREPEYKLDWRPNHLVTYASDGRVKDNVREDVGGLDFNLK